MSEACTIAGEFPQVYGSVCASVVREKHAIAGEFPLDLWKCASVRQRKGLGDGLNSTAEQMYVVALVTDGVGV